MKSDEANRQGMRHDRRNVNNPQSVKPLITSVSTWGAPYKCHIWVRLRASDSFKVGRVAMPLHHGWGRWVQLSVLQQAIIVTRHCVTCQTICTALPFVTDVLREAVIVAGPRVYILHQSRKINHKFIASLQTLWQNETESELSASCVTRGSV